MSRPALLLALLAGSCATERSVARAADGIAATAAIVGSAVGRFVPQQPPAIPTTREEALVQALPAIILDGLALWRAVSEAWVAAKALSAVDAGAGASDAGVP